MNYQQAKDLFYEHNSQCLFTGGMSIFTRTRCFFTNGRWLYSVANLLENPVNPLVIGPVIPNPFITGLPDSISLVRVM